MSDRRQSVILALALMLVALGSAPTAMAGPNADGVLLAHAKPSLVYTTDSQSYCGQSDLEACSLAVIRNNPLGSKAISTVCSWNSAREYRRAVLGNG